MLTCALRLLAARPARAFLKPLGAGVLAFSAAAALSPSAPTLATGANDAADHATEHLLVWLAHARARAEDLLAEPPLALRRFGGDWRALAGPDLTHEFEERRTALQSALMAISTPGGGAALEQLEELAAAINAAEETARRARQTAAMNASRIPWLELMRDAHIQRLDGNGGSAGEIQPEALLGKVVLLYFTAGWCGPCRDFTPRLMAAADILGAGKRLEVLHVSWDHDEAGMSKYTRSHGVRWLALPHAQRALARDLSSRYDVQTIPALVVLSVSTDGSSVEVLASEGRLDVLRFLAQREGGGGRQSGGNGSRTEQPAAPWIEGLLAEGR